MKQHKQALPTTKKTVDLKDVGLNESMTVLELRVAVVTEPQVLKLSFFTWFLQSEKSLDRSTVGNLCGLGENANKGIECSVFDSKIYDPK